MERRKECKLFRLNIVNMYTRSVLLRFNGYDFEELLDLFNEFKWYINGSDYL